MNAPKKDEVTTNPKAEKLNSSETEYLKTSNDKLVEIINKTKLLKNDLIPKSSKSMKSLNAATEFKEKSALEDNESFDEDDDDNIKIEKKFIEITKTTAAEVLNQPKLDPKENLQLLKFDLCYLVKKEFKWEVYHTPDETKKFLKKIYKFIKHDENAAKLVELQILEKLKEYNENQLLDSIDEIKKQFDFLLQSPYFDHNLIINEFLNIGNTSFSQYNNGVKPYEGWAYKKADPHCMRKVFGYICFCLEC